MNNPNVAPGGQPLDMLASVPGYQCSNADAVQSMTYNFGQQSDVADQASMAPQGTQPPFEKLSPQAMSTNPGPMGTDYKP